MSAITRLGESRRWSDVVIFRDTAYWVEVADDPGLDARGQIAQTLAQIDATLVRIGSSKRRLLQVLIYLADLGDAPVLNELWDAWVAAGDPPVRACVQAGLSPGYRIELVVTAAVGPAD